MMTAFATVSSAVEAIREGAFDYLAKPFKADQLLLAVGRAVRHGLLVKENRALRERVGGATARTRMIGSCPAMAKLREQIVKIGRTDANVLILGESGTGKELVARRIHDASRRSGGAFIPVDCASLPEGLLESELFGHEKGAFTGADQRAIGLVEKANGGTLLLDEINELSVPLQAKLLRTLEARQIRRLGGERWLDVDIRVLSATNVDLHAAIAAGRFREDLYFRLEVFPIKLPPLRERGDDLFLLAHHFIGEFSRDQGKEPPTVSPLVWKALERHPWTGNIRELRNLMERLVILEEGGHITLANLPEEMRPGVWADSADTGDLPGYEEAREAALQTFRAAYVERLLRRTGGNVSQAAHRAGVSRRTLHRWIADMPGASRAATGEAGEETAR